MFKKIIYCVVLCSGVSFAQNTGIATGICQLNVSSHMAPQDAYGKKVQSLYTPGTNVEACVATLVGLCEAWGLAREPHYLTRKGWNELYKSIEYYQNRSPGEDFIPSKRDPNKSFGYLQFYHCYPTYNEPVLDPSRIPSVVPNTLSDPGWEFRRFVQHSPQDLPKFHDLMEWLRNHRSSISWTVWSLIVAMLVLNLGGNAVAAFFSGGLSLSTTPVTAMLLVAAIVGILERNGYWNNSPASGPRASMESKAVDIEQEWVLIEADLGIIQTKAERDALWAEAQEVLRQIKADSYVSEN